MLTLRNPTGSEYTALPIAQRLAVVARRRHTAKTRGRYATARCRHSGFDMRQRITGGPEGFPKGHPRRIKTRLKLSGGAGRPVDPGAALNIPLAAG
jgi:hypothetical protein